MGWRATRGHEQADYTKKEKVRYWDYVDVLKNRSFRYIVAMFAVSNVAQALSNVIAVYWLVHTLRMSNEQIRAVGLFSGGLDSSLAIQVVRGQGIARPAQGGARQCPSSRGELGAGFLCPV